MIKAMSIDFWETLFDFVDSETMEKVRSRRIERFSELLGVSPEDIEDAYERAILELHQWREKTGFEFTIAQLMGRFLRKLNIDNYVDKCCRIFIDTIMEHFPGPTEYAVETINMLKRMGLKLAITSNTIHGEAERQLLKRHGLYQMFDALVFSCEIGVRKPRRDIFLRTSYLLGVQPPSIVHIGDDPVADMTGALKSGLWAVHYSRKREASDIGHACIKGWQELIPTLEQLELI